jgi:hypothetical protein
MAAKAQASRTVADAVVGLFQQVQHGQPLKCGAQVGMAAEHVAVKVLIVVLALDNIQRKRLTCLLAMDFLTYVLLVQDAVVKHVWELADFQVSSLAVTA